MSFGVTFESLTVVDVAYGAALLVLGYLAVLDYRTRRIPNRVWKPLFLGAAVLLLYRVVVLNPGKAFYLRLLLSLVFVGGIGLGSGLLGLFGGADAKALMWMSLLFPTFPTAISPVFDAGPGVFSLVVVTNALLVGFLYQGVLFVRNLVRGDWGWPMVLAVKVPIEEVTEMHGSLLETVKERSENGAAESLGIGQGLDLDVLRMYLSWRSTSLADLRRETAWFRWVIPLRHAQSKFGDGRISQFKSRAVNGHEALVSGDSYRGNVHSVLPGGDLWGAEEFVSVAERVYGESPESIRDGLEVVSRKDEVWVSPGLPFFIPLFVGLAISFIVGDIIAVAIP